MTHIDFTETLSVLRSHKHQFVLRKIDDQALLYPIVTNVAALSSYVTLNELGIKLWQELIIDDVDPKVVLKEIMEEFDCTEAELITDCEDFLKQLSSFMQKMN